VLCLYCNIGVSIDKECFAEEFCAEEFIGKWYKIELNCLLFAKVGIDCCSLLLFVKVSMDCCLLLFAWIFVHYY